MNYRWVFWGIYSQIDLRFRDSYEHEPSPVTEQGQKERIGNNKFTLTSYIYMYSIDSSGLF